MPQMGEKVSTAGDWLLEGKVKEVIFDSGIKAAHAKAAIDPPHWKEGEDYYGSNDFSSRAAVVLCDGAKKSGDTKSVKVKVEITANKNVSGDATLTGLLESLEIEGTVPTSVGTHDVTAEIKELPEGIMRFNGPLGWSADVKGKGLATFNDTKVEVFAVLERPALVFASAPGVWTEALRFLCTDVGVVGLDDEVDYLSVLATYLHSNHGLDYDHDIGSGAYLSPFDRNKFKLGDYITRGQGTTVNCHDQSAAVHVFAAAVGVKTLRQFLKPFGLINLTSLVGSGPCNNPLYKNPRWPDDIMVDPSSPDYLRRSDFSNHGFPERKKTVFDACSGPSVGLKRKAYLRASIDIESHRQLKEQGLPRPEYGKSGGVTPWGPIKTVT